MDGISDRRYCQIKKKAHPCGINEWGDSESGNGFSF